MAESFAISCGNANRGLARAVADNVGVPLGPDITVAGHARPASRSARSKLMAPPVGDVFVTDSIEQQAESWPGLHVVSVAPFLADAIRRLASRTLPSELPAYRA